MTAEVIIMNRYGLALAADSAVTVQHSPGAKIYNSANKLFMLSRYAPVGVMVYGPGWLTGIPWETIIKSFRRDLGSDTFPRLGNYSARLIEYINGNDRMFTEDLQRRQLLRSVEAQYRDITRAIDAAVKQRIQARGAASAPQTRSIVVAVIRQRHRQWTTAERLPGVPPDLSQRIDRQWRSLIEDLVDRVFVKYPVGAASRSRLTEIATLVFSVGMFPDTLSGLVVAGFGEDEYLPVVEAFEFEGVLANYVKVRKSGQHAISRANAAAILPFAQSEMVNLVLNGIDPNFQDHVGLALGEFADGLTQEMAASVALAGGDGEVLGDLAGKARHDLARRFAGRLDEYSAEHHFGPVISAVRSLPKEELATMAEALVSLTSFKRRITGNPETVGGPVDVALISKGDGFIWVNRKHHFDPALNHQFFDNYYLKRIGA